jgi:D-amino-acid dehydrogenase
MRDALRRAAQKRGTTILNGSALVARDGDSVTHVEVDGSPLTAGAVIIAGGAWSGALAAGLGLELPVYPQRGQILHLEIPDTETGRWPIILGFHSHYILTFPQHRVVAGATRESEAGFDVRATAAGVREALAEALRIAPGLADTTLHEVRVGLRPATPDGLPILGRAPGLRNAFLATGHGPSGLQLGPYSGAAVADLARGEQVDLAPFSPDRLAAG